ncbi:jg22804 [Pararge aegeria aegeria]|uniref:Jg22804 protein n=1 Tax=Pararge aegeria aegeria TaxID=348720 RepID=A0A8S4RWY9_9NEOP|nr:jg22804 [Pararge aegeria aegeria]
MLYEISRLDKPCRLWWSISRSFKAETRIVRDRTRGGRRSQYVSGAALTARAVPQVRTRSANVTAAPDPLALPRVLGVHSVRLTCDNSDCTPVHQHRDVGFSIESRD